MLAGLETSLQEIFQEVLKKEPLSVTANFFAEGGSQAQVWSPGNGLTVELARLALLAWNSVHFASQKHDCPLRSYIDGSLLQSLSVHSSRRLQR